jgi:cell wall-associated NlpC family hydrolase
MTEVSNEATPVRERLDPRRNVYREDCAAESLRGQIDVPRYVVGTRAQVARSVVPLRRVPVATAGLETEALFGEQLTVYDVDNGWAWVQLDGDGYVGYLPVETLTPDLAAPTHRVKSVGTFVYSAPDIKSPPVMHLSLNAVVSVTDVADRFVQLATGGYVVARHVADIAWADRDFVEVAERLLGTPYLWGGRTRTGLDCSALVQLSLAACGIAAPRDSDMQQTELGQIVDIAADSDAFQRGDLLFWNGHVGMMSDAVMLLHANAHHMAVSIEPLPEAIARISSTGSPLRAVKRLPAVTRVKSAPAVG